MGEFDSTVQISGFRAAGQPPGISYSVSVSAILRKAKAQF